MVWLIIIHFKEMEKSERRRPNGEVASVLCTVECGLLGCVTSSRDKDKTIRCLPRNSRQTGSSRSELCGPHFFRALTIHLSPSRRSYCLSCGRLILRHTITSVDPTILSFFFFFLSQFIYFFELLTSQ